MPKYCHKLVILSIFTTSSAAFAGGDLGDVGTFQKWSEIEIVLTGPVSNGLSNSPNPFKIPVDVVFNGPEGELYKVPAFYDGNGSRSLNGDVWKVRFAADNVGEWSFVSESSNSLLNSYQGTFSVIAPTPGADQFVQWGRLQHNAGDYYLKFADGPYWVSAGLDEPEDFLSIDVLGSWEAKKDAVDYLASKGVNAIILMLMNVSGDGDNVWPWVVRTESEHFNVAKLADWKDLFDHMQSRGIVLHLFFEDDDGWTGFDRSLYYREMIARFGHYNGLYWNIAEEFEENYTPEEVQEFAEQVREQDPYDHPISAHTHIDQVEWIPLLGDQNFNVTAFQSLEKPQNTRAIGWREDAAAAGWPVVVSYTETGKSTPADRALARHIEWSVYMAGGNYILHPFPITNFEPFDLLWGDLGYARFFVESLPFWEMEPDNDLVTGGSGDQYCFRKTGRIYAIYSSNGGSVSLNLSGQSGLFPVVWYNPRTGQSVDGDTVQGGGVVSLGDPPFTGDFAVTVGSMDNAPVAQDLRLSTSVSSDLSVVLGFSDSDGPGPYSYTVNAPINGTLSGDPPNLTYTAGPDFVAVDTFSWSVNDGERESNLATVTITVFDGTVVFKDDFTGEDSSVVGNGWIELETANGKTSIQNSALVFDALDDPFRPLVQHAMPSRVSGAVTLTFELNFKRSGSEEVYAFWIQLGEQALMSDSSPTEAGVAVNLKWASPTEGVATHEGLGYVVDGTVTHVGTVSGREVVGVSIDLDRQTYDVFVGDERVVEIPFEEQVSIDAIRFFTNGIRSESFSSREIDNLQYFVTRQPNVVPVAESQSVVTLVDRPVNVDLSVTDSDGPGPNEYVVNDPTNGTISGTPPNLIYTPNPGFSGLDAFTWSVSDTFDASGLGTVSIEVLESNVSPVAEDDDALTLLEVPVVVTLSATDPDGPRPLTYTVSEPANGTLLGTPPELSYTAQPGFSGIETILWSVNDGIFESNQATLTIDVVATNDAPVAHGAALQTIRNVPVAFTLEYVDPDGTSPYEFTLSEPANGILSGTVPSLTYTPNDGFFGIDSFTWSVEDRFSASEIALVTINVLSENSAPVAEGQTFRGLVGVPVDIFLDANDPDGPNPLVYTLNSPSSGAISGTPPALTYTASVAGLHSFTWSVYDGLFDSELATVTIEVFATNSRPTVEDQEVSTFGGAAMGILLAASDSDGPDPLQYTVNSPANGLLSGTPPDLTYMPGAGFLGVDSFTWSAFDGLFDSEFGTVTINVVENVAPVVEDRTIAISAGEPVALTLSFVDPDGPGPFTFRVLRDPVSGFVTGTPPDLVYTPIGSLEVTDFFTWSVNDGLNESNVGRVTIDSTPAFRRGDANDDGVTNITDVIRIVDHVYLGGPPSSCAAAMDVSDGGPAEGWAGVLWAYLYADDEAAPVPPEPGPNSCGSDSTESALDCDVYSSCDGPMAPPVGPPFFNVHFDAPTEVSGAGAGETFQVGVALDVSELDAVAGGEVRGFSLGIAATGCAIRNAIVSGAEVNQFVEVTEGPGNVGVVIAVMLPCPGVVTGGECGGDDGVSALGNGTHPLVTLEVEADSPDEDCAPCMLSLVDGLQGQHMSQPVENIIEAGGVSHSPTAEPVTVDICGVRKSLPFLRGDCDGDGRIGGSPTDAAVLLNWAFRGGFEPPCLAACDMNADGQAAGSPTDAVLLLQYVFLGGQEPPEPFPRCGTSLLRSDIALGCERSPHVCQ